MSWAFVDRYFDESYGVVDNRNKFMKNSPVDVAWLDSYLQALSECG